MRIFHGMGLALLAACSLSISACATRSAEVGPGVILPPLTGAAGAAAGAADGLGVPPPSEVSPGANTLIDDKAIVTAFQALDLAASAADTILAVKPSFAGSPAALKLAAALDTARHALNAASAAQRAQQATSYVIAMQDAQAAIASAKAAILASKGN